MLAAVEVDVHELTAGKDLDDLAVLPAHRTLDRAVLEGDADDRALLEQRRLRRLEKAVVASEDLRGEGAR